MDIATDGEAGWELVEALPYDLVLLDVMLPKLDGISFCRRLRKANNQILVMLLTARDTTTDKLMGLDSGADDYVAKPFNVQELVARIRALLRRGNMLVSPGLTCGKLRLDPNTREVVYDDRSLQFSRKEYLLLELFLRNQHRVFSRSAIVDQLWSLGEDPPNEDTIKSHIKNIRRELKSVGAGDFIETLYGQGYRINPTYLTETTSLEEPTATRQHRLDSAVIAIWERTKGASLARVEFLEQVVQLLQLGTLERLHSEKAIEHAHKLQGSLGTFGLEEGSRLAHQIEGVFQRERKQPSALSADDQQIADQQIADQQRQLAQQIHPLVRALRRTIEEQNTEAASVKVTVPSLSPSVEAEPLARSMLEERSSLTDAKILAVDDDPQILAVLQTVLESHWHLTCLDHPSAFWETMRLAQPDLLILDIHMPEMNGLELCRAIRRDVEWNWLPILILTVQADSNTRLQAFAAGADDFVTKPIDSNELITRIINRLKRNRLLRHSSEIDELTGIANRQQATQALTQLLQVASRFEHPVCLAVLDLDHFRQINDRYGHSVGDRILRQFGQFLKQKFRADDVVARWGGEEFVVGIHGIIQADGVERLATILEEWQSVSSITADGVPLSISFSAGIAQYPIDGTTLQMLYRTADAALYHAKSSGGDRILSAAWQPLSTTPVLALDILIVHPEDEFIHSLFHALSIRGYRVQWQQKSMTAIHSLRGKTPNLRTRVILLTSTLPDLDVLQFLRRLGAKLIKQTRIILLLDHPDIVEPIQSMGISDYFLAPYSIPVLIQRLRQVLEDQEN